MLAGKTGNESSTRVDSYWFWVVYEGSSIVFFCPKVSFLKAFFAVAALKKTRSQQTSFSFEVRVGTAIMPDSQILPIGHACYERSGVGAGGVERGIPCRWLTIQGRSYATSELTRSWMSRKVRFCWLNSNVNLRLKLLIFRLSRN